MPSSVWWMMVVAERPPTIEERAAAARDGDLEVFSKAVHNQELQPYQLAWEVGLDTENRIVIVCPPDTYKSTTVQNWVEKKIGHDPNSRTLWLMNAGEQAEKRVMAVMNTIEQNSVYKKAFPHVKPDKKAQWTKTTLYVERDRDIDGLSGADPTLMGCGLNGPYQGLHFDTIIIDDPTNQEDVRSPATMELQRAKIRGVILDRLVEAGRIVVILTRWGEQDLVPTFEELGFKIIVMPVVGDYPWGPTISETRFPMERVEKIHRDKGDVLFSLTYMGNAEAASGTAIARDHIRYWDRDMIPDAPLSIYIGVDPAASTKTWADPSAIATVGLDTKTRRIFLLDVFAERLQVPDLEARIVRHCRQTAGLRGVGVETVAFQLSLVQYLKRNHNLPLIELRYRTQRQAMHRVAAIDKDKVSRALYLDQLFISGRLFIPKGLPLFEGVPFETELVSISPTNTRHDDRMDAVAFACSLADSAMRPSTKVRISAW